MKIEIHYCAEWNYKPRAASLADEIKGVLGVDATLLPGGGGIFDVIADGGMIYSKFKTGRFPEHEEIIKILKE